MGDPRVNSCINRGGTDCGKHQCTSPGRLYYFCKTNRREGVCPIGLSTTYDDPEEKPARPFVSAIESQMQRFHEHHTTARWNLKDRMDSFQLYYLLDILQFRNIELAMMLRREGRYKDSHRAWAKHDAYNSVKNELFPYRDGGGKALNDELRELQLEIAEIEEKIEVL